MPPPPLICSINGFKYYVSFLDAHTHYTWLFPISCKSDVYSIFQNFQLQVECLFDCKIKIIQSDWGVSTGHFKFFYFLLEFDTVYLVHILINKTVPLNVNTVT